jgi:hypothetical protein
MNSIHGHKSDILDELLGRAGVTGEFEIPVYAKHQLSQNRENALNRLAVRHWFDSKLTADKMLMRKRIVEPVVDIDEGPY